MTFKKIATMLVAGTIAASGLIAVPAEASSAADRPCSYRKPKLHFMGETGGNLGGSRTVTLLNCHPTKRKAGIDVARGIDPNCKKIPYGETRKFTYMTLKGLAEYRKPKWC